MRSTCALAMPSAVAWLMNRSRQSGLVSESKVTTLMPASRASLRASQMASGSFAETTMPPTPCWVSVLMKLTWASGAASVGPTSAKVPPNSSTAALPPFDEVSTLGSSVLRRRGGPLLDACSDPFAVDPSQDAGGHHRGDEQCPGDDVDDVARDVREAQGAPEDADEQHARD